MARKRRDASWPGSVASPRLAAPNTVSYWDASVWGMLAVSVLAMGVSTGPKALHVFAVYIGRNDNAEYKVSRDRYAIYFCDRQTDFRKEPSVLVLYSYFILLY